jgi:hypothetical protein
MSTLSDIMDFDHVIEVCADGTVRDAPYPPESGMYAPTLLGGELEAEAGHWTLLDGYSGQCGYNGPVMHPSEYIGGRMERDILAEPGHYVVIAAYWTPGGDEDNCDLMIGEGWAVARWIG